MKFRESSKPSYDDAKAEEFEHLILTVCGEECNDFGRHAVVKDLLTAEDIRGLFAFIDDLYLKPQVLAFSGVGFSPEAMDELTESIAFSQRFFMLKFENITTGLNIITLSDAISHNPEIRAIDFHNVEIDDDEILALAEAVREKQSTFIHNENNRFSEMLRRSLFLTIQICFDNKPFNKEHMKILNAAYHPDAKTLTFSSKYELEILRALQLWNDRRSCFPAYVLPIPDQQQDLQLTYAFDSRKCCTLLLGTALLLAPLVKPFLIHSAKYRPS